MTEAQRTALLTACAFAKVFLAAADTELRGGQSLPRLEAQLQFLAACTKLSELAICANPRCGHTLGVHLGTEAGLCMDRNCSCRVFEPEDE